jgi:hypothetical protein
MVVAYMQESVPPTASLAERPGRFVGEEIWPSPRIVDRVLLLGEGTLGGSPPRGTRSIASDQTVGLEGGAWCADGRSADLPLDQRGEDARSLTYTSEPLAEPLEILGVAEARLVLSADRPVALVSARICEVQPDGTSLLVTRAQLNLCHRHSHAEPAALTPGEEVDLLLRMDGIGHRFEAGTRIRLSISPCYWPLAWPSPEPVTLTLRHGGGAALVLPERPPRAEDADLRPLDEPEEPEGLEITLLRSGSGGFRRIERDLASGRAELVFDWDCGGRSLLPNGIEYEDTSLARYSIVDGDPLSARVRVENTSEHARGDWQFSIRANGTMTCTATTFLVSSELEVYERDTRIFARTWTHEFPRDHG